MTAIKKTLPNGLRVVLVPSMESLSVSILVLVEAGSRFETKSINGISHFLEHMCLKGTPSRPQPIDLSSELDSLGSSYNAFTGQEVTGYYVNCLPAKFDQALDIISDVYKNPLFDEKEIEKEKGVICEEINMYEDMPQALVDKTLTELLYGDQPAGWEIAGTKETVKSLRREDFLGYRKKHYLAGSTVLAVAGKFDEKRILEKIENVFADMPVGDKVGKTPVVERQNGPGFRAKAKALDQTHLEIGFRSFGVLDPNTYVASVLGGVLGGGMSSRLFQRVRQTMGAAYYVRATHTAYSDHGYMDIIAGVDNTRLPEVVQAILEECKKFKTDLVPEKELRRVKDRIIGNTFLGLETPSDLANFYGGQEILKKELFSPEEEVAKIEAVKAEEIKALAEKIFVADKLNLAVVGPEQDEQKIVDILTI